jgi:hypothetical protein
VKTSHADRQSNGKKRSGKIDRTGKLVGLHSDQTDERFAAPLANLSDNLVRSHAAVGFVVGMQLNFYARTENISALRIPRQAIQTREGVGGYG